MPVNPQPRLRTDTSRPSFGAVFPPGRVSGLTLVELLAVVAIVGVLSALVLVVVGKTREAARAAGCLSNLRQIGAACLMYNADNRHRMVPLYAPPPDGTASVTWRTFLSPYLGKNGDPQSILRCPDTDVPGQTTSSLKAGTRPASYGMNGLGLHAYVGVTPVSGMDSDILRPAHTIMVCDIAKVSNPSAPPSDWVAAGQDNYGYVRFPSDAQWTSDAWNIFPRHSGRANVVYYDGHAGSVDVARDILGVSAASPACPWTNK